MNRLKQIALIAGACGALSLFSACADEFVSSPRGAEPEGAVEAPVAEGTASGEMASLATPGTALVTVNGPEGKNDHPTVHTIIDGIFKPPATGTPPTVIVTPTTTTMPTTIIKETRTTDPVSGPRE